MGLQAIRSIASASMGHRALMGAATRFYRTRGPVLGRPAPLDGTSSMFLKDFKATLSMDDVVDKKNFICDMDGVIYHGDKLLPGAKEFIEWMQREDKKFLFLTNSSERTGRELSRKMTRLGLDLDEDKFYTSADATAAFLAKQRPRGTAFVIGEPGVVQAIYSAGYDMNEHNPDYVVVGETTNINYDKIKAAVRCVLNGAKLIGTNCDVTDRMGNDLVPGTGALIAPIEVATGVEAYFVGKPNPLIMRQACAKLGGHRRDTVIVGDRMDTDIIAGVESDIDQILVLSGVTTPADLHKFAYVPRRILEGVKDIVEYAGNRDGSEQTAH